MSSVARSCCRCSLLALGVVASLAACQRPDDDGLGLDRPRASERAPITEPAGLVAALGQRGSLLDGVLGARGFDLARTFELTQGQAADKVEELIHFDSDGKGGFHLVHEIGRPSAMALAPARSDSDPTRDKVDTSAQGMEAVALGGKVYVRPRFGHFVARRPEAGELDRLREIAEQQLGDDLEVLQPWLVIADAGPHTGTSRKTRKLSLTKRASAETGPPASDARQGWRAGVKVAELTGELDVDAETGAPVSGHVETRYEIPREGGAVTVKLALKLTARAPQAITIPDGAAAAPTRAHPMVERNQLLQGLAPPSGTQAARGL